MVLNEYAIVILQVEEHTKKRGQAYPRVKATVFVAPWSEENVFLRLANAWKAVS